MIQKYLLAGLLLVGSQVFAADVMVMAEEVATTKFQVTIKAFLLRKLPSFDPEKIDRICAHLQELIGPEVGLIDSEIEKLVELLSSALDIIQLDMKRRGAADLEASRAEAMRSQDVRIKQFLADYPNSRISPVLHMLGDIEGLKWLLGIVEQVFDFSGNLYTMQDLCTAAYQGDQKTIMSLLASDLSALNMRTFTGEGLLSSAVKGYVEDNSRDLKVIRLLLAMDADRTVLAPEGVSLEESIAIRAEEEKDRAKKIRYLAVKILFEEAQESRAERGASLLAELPVGSATGVLMGAALARGATPEKLEYLRALSGDKFHVIIKRLIENYAERRAKQNLPGVDSKKVDEFCRYLIEIISTEGKFVDQEAKKLIELLDLVLDIIMLDMNRHAPTGLTAEALAERTEAIRLQNRRIKQFVDSGKISRLLELFEKRDYQAYLSQIPDRVEQNRLNYARWPVGLVFSFAGKSYTMRELCNAAYNGDLETIQKLLESDKSALNKIEFSSRSCLLSNAVTGFVSKPDNASNGEIIRLLLAQGADCTFPLGFRNQEGVIPLDQYITRESINTKDDAKRARWVEVKKLFDAAPRSPSAARAAAPASPAPAASSSEDWEEDFFKEDWDKDEDCCIQ